MRLRILIISFIVIFTSGFGFLSNQSSIETDLEDQQHICCLLEGWKNFTAFITSDGRDRGNQL